MKKQNLILVAILMTAATAAHAGGPATSFHAIADADNIDDGRGPDGTRGFVPAWNDIADADNLRTVAEHRLTDAPAMNVTWHPVADADTDASAGNSRLCTAARVTALR